MLPLLIILTGLIIACTMITAYQRTKDPLVPIIAIGPMLGYMYVYNPAMLYLQGHLADWFSEDQVFYAQLYFLCGVTCFCLGSLPSVRNSFRAPGLSILNYQLTDRARAYFFQVAGPLALLVFGVFCFLVLDRGGFLEVFSQPKAYVGHRIGYISEIPRLAYPALLLLAISRNKRSFRTVDWFLAILAAFPPVVMGTLGGRRGPAFAIGATIAICYFIIRTPQLKLRTVLAGVLLLGTFMLFLLSTRREIYLGSFGEINTQAFVTRLTHAEVGPGSEFIHACGMVSTARQHEAFTWGQRYFVGTFVRAIPASVWPNKYKAFGMQHLVTDPGVAGMSDPQWREAVGWRPLRGAAGGFLADMYVEFWWLGTVIAFALGRFYRTVWESLYTGKQGGILVYSLLMPITVHLVSQSLLAWLYRALLLGIPALLIWTIATKRHSKSHRRHQGRVRAPARPNPLP